MKMKSLKSKLVAILICAICLNQSALAGQFFYDGGVKKYLDDNGQIAKGWRWIDDNYDNVAECYRFGEDGAIATTSKFKGKDINAQGQWVVNGVVQRIYKYSGRPLYSANAALGEVDDNEYFFVGSNSETRRLNATKKTNLRDLIEADLRRDEENYRKSLIGPKGEFVRPEEGYLLSRGVKSLISKRPIATRSSWHIIDDALREDAIRYVSATESIIVGREMNKFVSASNKYVEKAENVKIWGGEVWKEAMVLQGNGAYVKFVTTDDRTKFKANYVTFEIAHQTHGESTADTYCGVELYLNGKSIAVYDEFCDDIPEVVEEYLDEGETSLELRAIVTGDAPGRKIYIRNARFRMIKERKDD